jgi:serine/threonine protein kinase
MSSFVESIRLPEQFGRYRIVRKLGEGGMGEVYLAHDPNLNRDVALKVCKQVDNPKALERFRKEAEAAARLRHQHLCPVYDYGVHDDTAYITMPHIEGQPLQRWVAEHR